MFKRKYMRTILRNFIITSSRRFTRILLSRVDRFFSRDLPTFSRIPHTRAYHSCSRRSMSSSTTCKNGTRTSKIPPDLPDWPATRLEFHSHTARSALGTYMEYKTMFPWIERYSNMLAWAAEEKRQTIIILFES